MNFLQKKIIKIPLIFLGIVPTVFFVHANYDKVNRQSCGGCSPRYYWTGWSPYNAYEERQYQMQQNGSGTISWSCSYSNGCKSNCSVTSSCSIHNASCQCSYSGGYPTGAYNHRPRWTCLGSPSVSLANAHVIGPQELPPSYTLAQNYYFNIVLADTANKCEYVCNQGYIIDTIGGVKVCRLPLCLNPGNRYNLANTYYVSSADNPANLQLTRDYDISINWVSNDDYLGNVIRTDTAAGCEFTCNPGYIRVDEGGQIQCRLPVCSDTASVLFTNATPVSWNELPASLTLTHDYTKSLIINGTDNPKKCEYTCLNAYRADLTATPQQCIPIVCIGNVASNGIKCADDEINLSGHLDINRVRRSNVNGCTGPQKCEWYCPAATPVYCATKNECVVNADDCGCPTGQKMCSCGQCINGNDICPVTCPVECNNDGICNNSESCDCSDCTNGDSDDTDHCKAGLRCTKDPIQICSEAACCPVGMTWSCDANTCVNACGTHAPSELKAGIDIPFITCDAKPGTTHFRYQIRQGATVYTSGLYPNDTMVRHTGPLVTVGTYEVQCFFGSSSASFATMSPDSCVKNMVVKSATDTTTQGCSKIYGYKGDTLSDTISSNTAFEASFRCGSRQDVSSQNLPYRITIGTQFPAYLQADPINILGIGFISTQTQKYTFTGATDVICAVRVGDGYSTNNDCKLRTCVGTNCEAPQTFVVTPSHNGTCTNGPSSLYDIGCNENSADYARCVDWFFRSGVTNTVKINNTVQTLTCSTTTPPGALGPVKTCTVTLPSGGQPVTLFAGDADSFQTTIYTLTHDDDPPSGVLEYYTNYSAGTKLDPSQYQLWQKQPVTAVIICTDVPGSSDGGGCACAPMLQENPTEQYWSPGIPNANPRIGGDTMTYTRFFMNNTSSVSDVIVRDTAGNVSPPIRTSIGIDSVAPKVTLTVPSTGRLNVTVVDPIDGGSGLWKPGALRPLPAGITKNAAAPAFLYRTFSKTAYVANPSAYEFDEKCGLTALDNGDYYKYGELTLAAATTPQSLTNLSISGIRSTFAATTSMIAYCMQDNAGNVTRGVYPSEPVGCFSSSHLLEAPTLATYQPLLIARLTNASISNYEKYGFSLSSDIANASCFNTLLSSNITTLITGQLTPESRAIDYVDWSAPAYIKGLTTPARNPNYYYYSNTTANAPAATATTLTPIRKIASSPTGSGTKTLLTIGENIQINSNISYTGPDKMLVIIARKNSRGAGGNIFIDPSVTQIDAILIADGVILNAQNGALRNSTTHASVLTNRLTINGRLYSFNTRGGSLIPSGTTLINATGTLGKYFVGTVLTATTGSTITKSVEQDFERFRMILADGNTQCSFHINYQALTANTLPPILQRPAGFTGGTCTF